MAEFTGSRRSAESETPSSARVKVLPMACTLSGTKRCREVSMSKGMDRKKEGKKKPAKTFEEKRAAKREKRETRRR